MRGDTTCEKLAALKPVFKDGLVIKEGRHITAGNASQLSDGASAQVLMDRATAEKEGLPVLGIYRGFQVAGCRAEEMGIGPVFAIPKLLARTGLKLHDIGLWEINEAFASPGGVLPATYSASIPATQCRRRRHCHRPSVRHDRIAAGGPRVDRGQATRREIRCGVHVRRRRHGRRRPV